MSTERIIITQDKINICLYTIVLLAPFVINSFEFNVVLSICVLFIAFLNKGLKISNKVLISLTLLLSVFIVSFISSFFYESFLYDIVKDVVYFIKPIIYVLLGYILASKIKDKDKIFTVVIFLGILISIVHILQVFSSLIFTGNFNISYIRYVGGKDNFLVLIACLLLILNKNNKYFYISFRFKKIVYTILLISFVLYFSRTMFVTFFIILLSVKGYTKLNKKAIVVGFFLIMGLLLFYRLLNSIDIERGASGFEGFLYKLKIAPSEIFSTDINLEDASERWDRWRAYEAKKAFDTMSNEDSLLPYISGMGLGGLVDLGFEARLGNENMQYIPKIHNGYVHVFFKSGLIGFVFYLLFLLSFYLQSYIRYNSEKQRFVNNFISGIAVFYLFTSFIISGVYNPKDVISIFLGALLFLQLHIYKNI